MTHRITRTAAAVIALSGACGLANAIPTLQLGILGGVYDTASETVIAQANSFKLYAFLTPGNGAKPEDVAALLADTYYISAAVVPKTNPPGTSNGSFKYGGTTVNVTSDMVFGSPPLETVVSQLSDPGDLADHGIFDTYFKQFSFKFSTNLLQTSPLDVVTGTGSTATSTSLLGVPDGGSGMYYASVEVDTSLLTLGKIHFDLYNSAVEACAPKPNGDPPENCVIGDVDINDFAPFSHDAQSGEQHQFQFQLQYFIQRLGFVYVVRSSSGAGHGRVGRPGSRAGRSEFPHAPEGQGTLNSDSRLSWS